MPAVLGYHSLRPVYYAYHLALRPFQPFELYFAWRDIHSIGDKVL